MDKLNEDQQEHLMSSAYDALERMEQSASGPCVLCGNEMSGSAEAPLTDQHEAYCAARELRFALNGKCSPEHIKDYD